MSAIERSADEARANNIAHMGAQLGELYSELWQEIAWLHRKWSEYACLFGASESVVELLNKAAPVSARTIQDALIEDVMLHVARLMDSPQSMNKPNLCLRRLPELVDHTDTRAMVEAHIQTAIQRTAFCKDWRNRRIAHRDLEIALGKGAVPLMTATRLGIDEALKSVVQVLDPIAAHYLKMDGAFFHAGPELGGAQQLIYVLGEGLKAIEARRHRAWRGSGS